jgi:segregation and condensation protein A
MSTPASFAVELPLFSGPFGLLADLILDQQMDVCDIPVARITDRFLREGLERMEGWPLEEATWFVAVCAVLLELKVGRLLPRPAALVEEELLGGAAPDLAYARSLELAAFRQAAQWVAERLVVASRMVPRTAGPPSEFAHLYPDVMEKVTADRLRGVAAEVLAPPKDLDLSHVTPIRVSLAEALLAVEQRMGGRGEARFRDLIEGCRERIEVVVRFLALLELHREGKVELSQANVFGDINVRWQGSTEVEGSSPRGVGGRSNEGVET